MGTFGGMTRFRSGYWKGIREWLLRESIDIPKRVAYIERERRRIGRIIVEYERVQDPKGNYIANENRLSFSVTPNSSLEKLIKSYIIMGGNPMDISMFMYPNTSKIYDAGDDDLGSDVLMLQKYPYDGKVSPVNRKDVESTELDRGGTETTGVSYSFGADTGGSLNALKYQPPRVGDGARLIWDQDHTIQSAVMHDLRNWSNQEIAEKLHLLEHKIIKLCDLEEQFRNELEVLTKAFGSSISALFPYYYAEDVGGELSNGKFVAGTNERTSRFHLKNSVQWLVYDMDKVFFDYGEELGDVSLIENVENMLEVKWAYPDFESESVLDFCL